MTELPSAFEAALRFVRGGTQFSVQAVAGAREMAAVSSKMEPLFSGDGNGISRRQLYSKSRLLFYLTALCLPPGPPPLASEEVPALVRT